MSFLFKKIVFLLIIANFISCSNLVKQRDNSFNDTSYRGGGVPEIIRQNQIAFFNQEDEKNKNIVTSISQPLISDVDLSKRHDSFLSEELKNDDYKKWITFYTSKDNERFQRHINNGEKYREYVLSVLESYDLPSDLYYVGLIESGYSSYVKSHVGATGYWQFMKGTALKYGLIVNRNVDERASIEKSTHAAAKYFSDLYNIFGSWELAIVAYNSGEYRVIRAIQKGKTRSLAELIEKKLLPPETRNYIPKMLAAKEIVEKASAYGFSTKTDSKYVAQSKFLIKRNTSLKELNRMTGLTNAQIKMYNPDIRSEIIQVASNGFYINLPSHYISKLDKHSLSIATKRAVASFYEKKNNPKTKKLVVQKNANRYKVYRVKRGDNLITLSKKFNVPVSKLKKINNIKKTNTLYVNAKIKIPISSRGA